MTVFVTRSSLKLDFKNIMYMLFHYFPQPKMLFTISRTVLNFFCIFLDITLILLIFVVFQVFIIKKMVFSEIKT